MFLIAWLLFGRHLQAGEAQQIDAGTIKLEVCISRTAHLFHVVDQLSAWSEFSHRQYASFFEPLDDRDRELLAKHVAVRNDRPWGQGLEQTFYTPADLETALREGVKVGWLTAAQARTEREVLTHFAPRIERLLANERGTLERFRTRLADKASDLERFSEKLSRFCHGVRPTVPVYLLANPSDDSIGGGYNGGRLTLEVPRVRDAYPSFLHEIMHAFLDGEKPRIEGAAKKVNGLDAMTLNEGIAYALAPGLIHADSDGPDPLARQVASDLASMKPLDDAYTRFNRFGLALRPLLKQALEHETATLESFLPRATDAWRVVTELDTAISQRTTGQRAQANPARKTFFSTGPGWKVLGEVVRADLYARNHTAEHYRKIIKRARPGDTLVLLFALDHSDRIVPEEYRDLMPQPW